MGSKRSNERKIGSAYATEDGDVIVDCGKTFRSIGINVSDIYSMLDVAMMLRCLFLIVAPEAKSGTRGGELVKVVENLGETLVRFGKRIGFTPDVKVETSELGICSLSNKKKCKSAKKNVVKTRKRK